jgi:hypothetical protein
MNAERVPDTLPVRDPMTSMTYLGGQNQLDEWKNKTSDITGRLEPMIHREN